MSNMYYCPNCGAVVGSEEGASTTKCGACGHEFAIYNPPISDNMEGNSYNNAEQQVENFNLITAYVSMFKKYFQFSGRSRRSEYWLSMLANGIIMAVLYTIMGISMAPMITSMVMYGAPPTEGLAGMAIVSILITVYSLAVLIPGIAMCVRRLHDTGKSGWFYFIGLIPTVGAIILLVFFVSDSQPGANQYGPNPKGV